MDNAVEEMDNTGDNQVALDQAVEMMRDTLMIVASNGYTEESVKKVIDFFNPTTGGAVLCAVSEDPTIRHPYKCLEGMMLKIVSTSYQVDGN